MISKYSKVVLEEIDKFIDGEDAIAVFDLPIEYPEFGDTHDPSGACLTISTITDELNLNLNNGNQIYIHIEINILWITMTAMVV